MKYIFVCVYLIFSFSALAQKVKYSIEIITPDSFYLIEQAVIGTKARPDTLNAYMLFRDTAAYKLYVEDIDRDARRLEREYLRLKLEFDSLDSRVKRLSQLGKNKLGIQGLKAGGGSKKADKDSEAPEVERLWFWVVYTENRKTVYRYVDYITENELPDKATFLMQNGTITNYKKVKKKK